MSLETALGDLVLSDDDVRALIDDRMQPLRSTQGGVRPDIQYHQMGGGKDYCMRGADPDRATFWQLDCWGRTYAEAKQLADAVIADDGPLSAFRGTKGGVRFQGIFIVEEFDAIEPPAHGNDIGLYWIPVGIQVWTRG